MSLASVKTLLASPTHEAIEALFEDQSLVFWVDWREEEESIVTACEAILNSGSLSVEWLEAETGEEALYIRYRDQKRIVPLTYSPADRHIALCTLSEVLKPDYEIRFCIDSNGSDTLAFAVLNTQDWSELEQIYPDTVRRHFYSLATKPNLFTDPLSHAVLYGQTKQL